MSELDYARAPFTPDTKTAARVIECFLSPSQSLTEIASAFGTDLGRLCDWMATPRIQATLDALAADAAARTRSHARRAIALLRLDIHRQLLASSPST